MCTSPNYLVWLGGYHPETHKEKLVFQPHCNYEKLINANIPFVEVGCGKCLECKQQQSSMWSDRCVFEAMQHEHNYFLTLTYDDLHVPLDGCLKQEHMQKFLKRLRKYFSEKLNQNNIRYFYVAEYGGNSLRPHYHLILFNCYIPDLSSTFELLEADGRYHKHNRPGSRSSLKYSRIIYDLWQNQGMISVDEFNYNTAAYVAGYVNKKVDEKHNYFIKKFNLTPEFHRMSTNPGIGAGYFTPELFNKSCLIVPRSGGAKHSVPPRYFEKLLDKDYPWLFNDLRNKRCDLRHERLTAYKASDKFKDTDNEVRAHRLKTKNSLRNKV